MKCSLRNFHGATLIPILAAQITASAADDIHGFLITIIPVLIIGSIAYKWLRINYFKVIGLMAGALTAAPALGYAESLNSSNDQASVCYATVYPLTTFMRVMLGQLLVLFFCS